MLCCKGDTPSKYPSENSPSPPLLRGSANKTNAFTYQLAETICQLSQASVGLVASSWHRIGPRDMSFEAKGFRHVAVAVTELRICCGIAMSPRQLRV
jgi:hypothetical protein